jgi:hypothetical protein
MVFNIIYNYINIKWFIYYEIPKKCVCSLLFRHACVIIQTLYIILYIVIYAALSG